MTFTLGNKLAANVHLEIGLYGVATADVALDAAGALSGRQTLVVGDLSLVGTIVDGGVIAGRGRYTWHAGAGGWRNTIPARGYTSSIVVRSSVLRDAAQACGETISIGVGDINLGLPTNNGFVRAAGPAWDIFKALSAQTPLPWYIDSAGVTQVSERPTLAASTDGTLEGSWSEDGRLVIVPNAERIAGYLPGRTLGGATIATLHVDACEGEPIRLTIWTKATDPSHDLRTQLDRLHAQNASQTRFHGRYRYRVVSRNGTLYGLEPVDTTQGLPLLDNRDLWFGIPGFDAQLFNLTPPRAQQITIIVTFLDGLASQPVIDGYMRIPGGLDAPITIERVSLTANRVDLGDAQQKVARETDPVRSGNLTVTASLIVPGALAIRYVDESSVTTEWTVTALAGATPVAFTIAPPTTAATINGTIQTPNQGKVYA